MSVKVSDVAIIGAGVVGTAVARELAISGCSVNVIESSSDVGNGTSKANTAILHTGFDATPGTHESRLVRQGHKLLLQFATDAGIAIEKTNALMIAWDDEQLAQLSKVIAKSIANNHTEITQIDASEVARIEPNVAKSARGGLMIAGEFIIDPWSVPIAFARQACDRGATFTLGAEVLSIEVGNDITSIFTTSGTYFARFVVNAAGLSSSIIDNMFSPNRFSVVPRRGELIVFDKIARNLVSHIILPVPQAHTKGVLVTPTVFGNLMVGPTADDVEDPSATGSTQDGVARVLKAAHRIIPSLINEEVTAIYAGLRASTNDSDYQLWSEPAQRYVCLGGIRSTGLSSSMALAKEACERLRDCGLELNEQTLAPSAILMPPLGERQTRPADLGEECVCHCERVTADEIVNACAHPIGATSLDGVRRRTRALNGRCQGFYCLADVCAIVSQTTGISAENLLGKKS